MAVAVVTGVTAPARSGEQRMAALARANEIRVRRAQMKRDLAAGAPYTELLVDPPAWLASMKALDFLKALPKLGTVKASRVLNVCRVSHAKTLGGLSDRQRRDLLRELEQREPV